MGLLLQIDLQEPAPLASILGFRELREWIETLPADESQVLRHLCEYGWTGKAAELQAELKQGLDGQPPSRHDTADTAENLLQLLTKAGKAEVVSVTDGMGEDDGEEDENGQPVTTESDGDE